MKIILYIYPDHCGVNWKPESQNTLELCKCLEAEHAAEQIMDSTKKAKGKKIPGNK